MCHPTFCFIYRRCVIRDQADEINCIDWLCLDRWLDDGGDDKQSFASEGTLDLQRTWMLVITFPALTFSCYAMFEHIWASCFDQFVPFKHFHLGASCRNVCADVLDQGVILLMWDCKCTQTGLMETLQKLWFHFKRWIIGVSPEKRLFDFNPQVDMCLDILSSCLLVLYKYIL